MGGGAAARSLARVSGFGALRSVQSPLPEGMPVGRQAARPGAGVASAALAEVPGFSALHVENEGPTVEGSAAWELDDWELAGDEEVEIFNQVNRTPRLVFGPAPSIEEARDATFVLKDALEEMCFSSSGGTGSSDIRESSGNSITKTCSSQSISVVSSIPKPVITAYSLLKESPEAQNVVAALAADKNVWEAVMKNEKVMEFCHSNHAGVLPREKNMDLGSVAESIVHKTHESDVQAENGIDGIVKNIRVKVAEVVTCVSDFFQDAFGFGEGKNSVDGKGSSDFSENAVGASFMVLAILAMLVVLFKRN